MRKVLLSFLVFTFVFSLGVTVNAEENSSTDGVDRNTIQKRLRRIIPADGVKRADPRAGTKVIKRDLSERVIDKERDVKEKVRENKDRLKRVKRFSKEELRRFQDKRADFKKDIVRKRDNFRDNFKEKREEARKKIEDKRAEFKEKLKRIKDERKKQIVEKISERLNALNERLMERFSNILDKFAVFLERVESRAAKAEEYSKDVSSARAFISEAQVAIDNARSAVTEQSGKVYEFEIDTEDNLRANIGRVRKVLHQDITAVKETVKNAHDAIRRAVVALARIPKIDEFEVSAGGGSASGGEAVEGEETEEAN